MRAIVWFFWIRWCLCCKNTSQIFRGLPLSVFLVRILATRYSLLAHCSTCSFEHFITPFSLSRRVQIMANRGCLVPPLGFPFPTLTLYSTQGSCLNRFLQAWSPWLLSSRWLHSPPVSTPSHFLPFCSYRCRYWDYMHFNILNITQRSQLYVPAFLDHGQSSLLFARTCGSKYPLKFSTVSLRVWVFVEGCWCFHGNLLSRKLKWVQQKILSRLQLENNTLRTITLFERFPVKRSLYNDRFRGFFRFRGERSWKQSHGADFFNRKWRWRRAPDSLHPPDEREPGTKDVSWRGSWGGHQWEGRSG